MKTPIKRTNLSDQVIDYLLEYIKNSKLKPGDFFLSENEVSTNLGVSRGIVREAFRSLAAQGIIEVNSGKRAVVQKVSGDIFVQLINHGIITQQIEVDNVLELRSIIEVGSVRLAAQRANKEDIYKITSIVHELEKIKEDQSLFIEYDIKYHSAIAEATKNPVFIMLVNSLRKPIQESIRKGLYSQNKNPFIKINEAHIKICKAIEDKKSEVAAELMRKHLEVAREAVRKNAK